MIISSLSKISARNLVLAVLFFSAFLFAADPSAAPLEKSQIIPLPAQLQKDILPWFVARNSEDRRPFSRVDLAKVVKPETKKVALVFFATWCIPCREGAVKLRENFDELVKNNVQVILVNAGESDLKQINEWVKKFGDERWLLLLDKFQSIPQKSGLLPEGQTNIVFPKTILTDSKLKPLLLIGAEGADYPSVLWQ